MLPPPPMPPPPSLRSMAPLGRLDRKLDGSAEERLLLLPLPAQDRWEGVRARGSRGRGTTARRRGCSQPSRGVGSRARRTVQRRRRRHCDCFSGGARRCGHGGGGAAAATAAGMCGLGGFGRRLDGRAVARKREVDCTARVTIGLRLGLGLSHSSGSVTARARAGATAG